MWRLNTGINPLLACAEEPHCINSAALRFIHLDDLEAEGYEEYKALFREGDQKKESV